MLWSPPSYLIFFSKGKVVYFEPILNKHLPKWCVQSLGASNVGWRCFLSCALEGEWGWCLSFCQMFQNHRTLDPGKLSSPHAITEEREARTGSSDLSREVSSGPAAFRMQVAWFPGQNIPFSAGKRQAPVLSWPSWGQPSCTREFMETSFIGHHKGWGPQPRPQGHTETS